MVIQIPFIAAPLNRPGTGKSGNPRHRPPTGTTRIRIPRLYNIRQFLKATFHFSREISKIPSCRRRAGTCTAKCAGYRYWWVWGVHCSPTWYYNNTDPTMGADFYTLAWGQMKTLSYTVHRHYSDSLDIGFSWDLKQKKHFCMKILSAIIFISV